MTEAEIAALVRRIDTLTHEHTVMDRQAQHWREWCAELEHTLNEVAAQNVAELQMRERIKAVENSLRDQLSVQANEPAAQEGGNPYMVGLYNGLLMALCNFTDEDYEPRAPKTEETKT